MDSSNFKRGQLSLCLFEVEVASLRCTCRKENHYLRSCPEVLVLTDCKEMISTYAKPLENIENRRIQKMFMDISHLNLKLEHVPGIKNCTADFRSRRPRDSFEAVCEQDVPIKLRLGVRTVRAQRMMLNTIDPRIGKLAEVGHEDTDYRMMIHHVEQQTENRNLEENSELKKIGVIMRELGLYECENGRKLVIRNSQEILIPKMARKEMLWELHSTHMSVQGMKRLARKKFWWPAMSKDLEQVYETCEAYKENSISKSNVPGKNGRGYSINYGDGMPRGTVEHRLW